MVIKLTRIFVGDVLKIFLTNCLCFVDVLLIVLSNCLLQNLKFEFFDLRVSNLNLQFLGFKILKHI